MHAGVLQARNVWRVCPLLPRRRCEGPLIVVMDAAFEDSGALGSRVVARRVLGAVSIIATAAQLGVFSGPLLLVACVGACVFEFIF